MVNEDDKNKYIVEETCAHCKNKFSYKLYGRRRKRKYCSPECYYKEHSKDFKEKWKHPEYKESHLKKMLSESNKIFKGKTYEEIYGFERAKEIKKLLRDSHKGQYPTNEQRLKTSAKLKGHEFWGKRKHSIETNIKRALSLKGHRHTEETKIKIGLKNKNSIKKLWQDPEYKENQVKKIIKGWKNNPTKPEFKILNIIHDNDMPFNYNGFNGDIVIGGKVPDFVSSDGSKKVIEVFGRLFHDPNFSKHLWSIPESKTYEKTIEHYKKYGYECLIIWEDQINEKLIIDQIKRFVSN